VFANRVQTSLANSRWNRRRTVSIVSIVSRSQRRRCHRPSTSSGRAGVGRDDDFSSGLASQNAWPRPCFHHRAPRTSLLRRVTRAAQSLKPAVRGKVLPW